jgi:hypothetical protein
VEPWEEGLNPTVLARAEKVSTGLNKQGAAGVTLGR